MQSKRGSAVEAAGVEPASRDMPSKNVYVCRQLLFTLLPKLADYRRQVGYHHLALSCWARSADYRRHPDWAMGLRTPHSPPNLGQAARAGACAPARNIIEF